MSSNVFDAPPIAAKEAVVNSARARPRHLASVRIFHWAIAAGVLGLIVTGIGILISHPRLYWGETGTIGMPSLVDLPLPTIIGPSVQNRASHFFFAWVLVLGALGYVIAGFATKHFRRDLWPARADLNRAGIAAVLSHHLRWTRLSTDDAAYNVVQQLTYIAVVFLFFPGVLWTGLAMSPGLTSALPFLATSLGGHQSARTLHFLFAVLLLLFFLVHMAMLFLVGFVTHVRAMLTGTMPKRGNAP